MGLFKKLGFGGGRPSTSNAETSDEKPRKRSLISLVPLSEVTAESLKVWRQLPGSIRHDPSMISFQQENARWKGKQFLIICLV